MKILVVNAGSSSLKYQLIDMKTETAIAKGGCERIGLKHSFLKGTGKNGSFELKRDMPDHTVAVKLVLETLTDKIHGVIRSMKDIDAVGHRVVHSAEDFDCSVLIDNEVLAVCENNAGLAPLHMPSNIMGIRACREVMPNTPMAAVFDTAFHSTMPPNAFMYAIPYEAYTEWKIRKYGFHGTSHKFVSGAAAKFLKKDITTLKMVTCHLGNGASIAAVKNGKCVDTSMGLTPLEGLVMGTRSGDIDPSVIEYLMKKAGMSAPQVLEYLNKKSGVLGISGVSSDFRDIISEAEKGNSRARLAIEVFCYRVRKYIGSYAAAMGGLDVIVFTAGVGENCPSVRAQILDGLEFLGVNYDKELNNNIESGKNINLTSKGAKVKTLIIPTNEELVIARETLALVLGGP